MVAGVHATDKTLGIVSQKLQDGNHGKAAVRQLLLLSLLQLLGRLSAAGGVTQDQEATVVDGTDQEEHLHPTKGRHSLDGGNTVGDGLEGHTRGDLTRELEDLRHDVANDGKLGHAAVLQLGSTVVSEGLSIDVLGQAYTNKYMIKNS